MKVKLKTDEYTIFERRDGRFAVQDALGKPVNGAEKIEILLQHEFIDAVLPSKEWPSSEETTEEVSADSGEGGEPYASSEETGEEAEEPVAEKVDIDSETESEPQPEAEPEADDDSDAAEQSEEDDDKAEDA